MSNIKLIQGQKVSAAFQHLQTSSMSEGVRGGMTILNYGRKVWSLRHQKTDYHIMRDDDTPAATVDVIILAVAPYVSQTYYPEWRGDAESAGKQPVCRSLKGDKPDADASVPQSKLCGTCAHNRFITKPNGSRGTECQPNKRMAVLLLPSVTKKLLGAPLLEPVFFKVPPGSFATLKQYDGELQHEGYPFSAIVTRLGFAPDKQFQLTFQAVQVLSDAEAPVVLPLIDNPQTQGILGVPVMYDPQRTIEVAPSRVETGLLDAVKEAAPAPKPTPVQYPKTNGGSGTNIPPQPAVIDDGDADLDAEVAKLLNKKTDTMLR